MHYSYLVLPVVVVLAAVAARRWGVFSSWRVSAAVPGTGLGRWGSCWPGSGDYRHSYYTDRGGGTAGSECLWCRTYRSHTQNHCPQDRHQCSTREMRDYQKLLHRQRWGHGRMRVSLMSHMQITHSEPLSSRSSSMLYKRNERLSEVITQTEVGARQDESVSDVAHADHTLGNIVLKIIIHALQEKKNKNRVLARIKKLGDQNTENRQL